MPSVSHYIIATILHDEPVRILPFYLGLDMERTTRSQQEVELLRKVIRDRRLCRWIISLNHLLCIGINDILALANHDDKCLIVSDLHLVQALVPFVGADDVDQVWLVDCAVLQNGLGQLVFFFNLEELVCKLQEILCGLGYGGNGMLHKMAPLVILVRNLCGLRGIVELEIALKLNSMLFHFDNDVSQCIVTSLNRKEVHFDPCLREDA